MDFENGTLFFYDARPFAPRLAGPSAKSWDQRLDLNLRRRARLLNPDRAADDGQNVGIYDNHYVNLATDVEYYIDVEYTASRVGGEITLGRGNILEGSEVVTINGQAQTRGRDYEIDYDLGRVTLKKQLGPTDNLNVDYAYAPLFQQAGRTLVGSAFRLEGRDKSFGGAFMYESRGAQARIERGGRDLHQCAQHVAARYGDHDAPGPQCHCELNDRGGGGGLGYAAVQIDDLDHGAAPFQLAPQDIAATRAACDEDAKTRRRGEHRQCQKTFRIRAALGLRGDPDAGLGERLCGGRTDGRDLRTRRLRACRARRCGVRRCRRSSRLRARGPRRASRSRRCAGARTPMRWRRSRARAGSRH